MEDLSALPTAIYPSLVPTIKAFTPQLRANAEAIKSVPRTTHSYGPHERQQLDVYEPAQATDSNGKPAPILVFIYGGGFQNGDKVCPEPFPDDLIYTNLGYFFSQKLNLRTVIPDYRLIRHAAAYPSGGEDVALALEWVKAHYPGSADAPQDLFLMGNSAGGVHAATFLLAPEFASAISSLQVPNSSSPRLRGAVFLGTPFDFQNAEGARSEVLDKYFGGAEQPMDPHGNPLHGVEAHCPYGLMRALSAKRFKALPRMMVMWSERDPEDEIIKPQRRFVTMWNGIRMGRCETRVLEGHNHLSPPFGLGTGDQRAEKWGHDLGSWIEDVRKGEE